MGASEHWGPVVVGVLGGVIVLFLVVTCVKDPGWPGSRGRAMFDRMRNRQTPTSDPQSVDEEWGQFGPGNPHGRSQWPRDFA